MNTSTIKDLEDDEYIVARIAGMKTTNGRRHYLVEWDGYDISENTWEYEKNVNCKESIEDFVKAYAALYQLRQEDILPLTKKILLNETYDPDTRSFHPLPPKDTKSKIPFNNTTNQVSGEVTTSLRKRLREDNELCPDTSKMVKSTQVGVTQLTITSARKYKSIEEIAQKVMAEADKNNSYPIEKVRQIIKKGKKNVIQVYQIMNVKAEITIVNEYDNTLPDNFIYIDELKYTLDVPAPDPNFLSGCVCSKGKCTSCHDSSAYNRAGKLICSPSQAINECNQHCDCGPACNNRVVQKGRKIPLQIFRTRNRGWGIRSPVAISSGTFVEEYVGEVITADEADERGRIYDQIGCSYLFDMDYAQSELPIRYSIDSYMTGNASRFFNHSCSPNLKVMTVFIDSSDNQMHRIAFFASRDIRKNEELCFDYNGSTKGDVSQVILTCPTRYPCKCNAYRCRKWIYSA